MKSTVIKGLKGSRKLWKEVPTEDGKGRKSVQRGVENFKYDVLMDYVRLGDLAVKAARNRRGRSTDGPLEVVITSAETVEVK